jgi:hypothetical protein
LRGEIGTFASSSFGIGGAGGGAGAAVAVGSASVVRGGAGGVLAHATIDARERGTTRMNLIFGLAP